MCLTGGRIRCAPLALAAWTWTTPTLGLPGGILPRMVGPSSVPNLYDLPSLQSIVEQIGGGAFAPTHSAGQPWTPQTPMTRVILPSDPGTEWAPPSRRSSRWVRDGLGRWVHGVLRRAVLGRQQPYGRRYGLLAEVALWRTTDTSLNIPSKSTARTSSQSPCGAAGTGRSWRRIPVWARWYV